MKTTSQKKSASKIEADKIEKKLKEMSEINQKQFENVLLHSPNIFIILEGFPEMIITFANEALYKSWGKTADIIGKSLMEVVPEIKDQNFPALLEQVFETGKTHYSSEERAVIHINGNSFDKYYNYVYQPIFNNEKKVTGVTAMATDITELVFSRKTVEESEKKYRTLFTSIDQGFSLCELIRNKDGKGIDVCVLEVNPTYEQQTGIKKEMIIGKNLMQVFPSSHNWIETYTAMVDNQRPVVFENYFEGTDRWFAIKAYPVEKEKFVVLFNDVTSQKQASQYARSLIEASLDPLVTISATGKILDVNEASIKVTGVEREKLIDTDFSDYFTEPKKAQEGYRQVFEKGFVADYPLTIKHKNGNLTDVLYNASVYKDAKGSVLGVFAAARDVTSQKQASQYARSLIEASLDPLVTISATGKILDVNQASIKVTGIAREKLIGTDFSDYFTEPKKAKEGYRQVFEKGFVADYPLTIKHKNGNLTDVLYNASVYKDAKGNVLGVFAAARDVTERKMFEKELIDAKVSAENATKSKQQFLSNMSHEIRTPLNSILGFTNVLLKTELGAEQKEFLQAIKTSGMSLNLLINDILDLAKVDSGKMTFEKKPFEIFKSITSILHSFDLKIKENNLEFIKEYDSKIPAILCGDSLKLNQIILNLTSNAVKFTHQGKIKLSVKLLSETEENVSLEFTVTDTGIGIADNKLNSIFNIFEQAEINTSTSYGGTGLGLAIVKQLVEGQAGSVSVKSKLGEGSVFSFILSFGKTNLKLKEEIVLLKPVSEIKNLRVLVAEDVALNQLLIKIILNDFGFEHEIVGNGKLAVEKMQNNTYDIILMDLQMPEMSGYEATAYIRKTLKSHIPIIALTADVTTADVSKCKEFGMDDYISKPINENLLYSKILELVKNK